LNQITIKEERALGNAFTVHVLLDTEQGYQYQGWAISPKDILLFIRLHTPCILYIRDNHYIKTEEATE
jgi:hypothetical protein